MSSGPLPSAAGEEPRYEVASLAQRPDLLADHQRIGGAAWPEFMLHDPVAQTYWDQLMADFADYQLSLLAGDEILAVVNAVPLRFDGAVGDLPDRGVDWGVEKAVRDHENARAPNALMGVQIVVKGARRGTGLSGASAGELITLAARKGLARVILPLRPSHKHRFPLIPMARYIAWTNEAGLPYDAWLRVHARLGGEIAGICSQSMIIRGTLDEWSAWTGLEFPGSGRYLVPGALAPIDVDLERDEGVYREPNVWVVHNPARPPQRRVDHAGAAPM